ncbi:MAG: cation:proton antiporter [Candidatus Moranbacteria bacterium]|nr:cation:proton antiporter [Candidatus Moranbacteria bacterium]
MKKIFKRGCRFKGDLLKKKNCARGNRFVLFLIISAFFAGAGALAASGHGEGHGGNAAQVFFWIAIILIAAKLSGLVEKWGQPSVLGELTIGIILGNLTLLGINFFEPIKDSSIIDFLAQLGVVILLFQIGLESNIKEMKRVGIASFVVAIIGVVAPFLAGTYLLGPWLWPEAGANTHIFLGATLTATSVGITARVFKDLGKLKMKESQIVLGAAVIDDILGLIILAVVSNIIVVGAAGLGMIGWIAAKAVIFLIGAIVIGGITAPYLSRLFSIIHTGVKMKFAISISFCLVLAYLAKLIGLEPIVGAFAAGLVLDPVHFRYFKDPKVVSDVKEKVADCEPGLKQSLTKTMNRHAKRHIEDLIEPVGEFLVPIFFVMTGMAVQLESLFDTRILSFGLILTLAAIASKLVAGLGAGKGVNKLLVGAGMVPRGEVGLIFASIGMGLGVISNELFSIIIIMVILTTLVSPVALGIILNRDQTPQPENG